VIVPDKILHYLAFQALTDGKRSLLEDYTISYSPSASVLKFALEKRKDAIDTLISFGDPKVEGLPNLRYAAQEALSVSDLYNAQAFIGDEATESELKAVAGSYSILHIAAHGEYNPVNPLFSALRLAADREADGRLEVHEVYQLNLEKTDLVVLSACETHLGQLRPGDEVIGLNRAFVYAGTPTVIASLWAVDDEATAQLMERFYIHLQNGLSKAQALRAAQKEIRDNPKWAHPYYWAAFILTGDPGKASEVSATQSLLKGKNAQWVAGILGVLLLFAGGVAVLRKRMKRIRS
jgi:CHAT domain-containing protein